MPNHNAYNLTEAEVKTAIENTDTMGAAAQYLKCNDRTFKKYAEKYGLYKVTGQYHRKFKIEDIFDGKHPQYKTSHLSKRLVAEGFKEYKCECCGISEWNGKKISLDLDHINGDSSDHSLDNLRLMCPNCHSQTDTYKSKNRKNKLEGTVLDTNKV